MSSSPSRYSVVAITLHWIIALCILCMIPMGWWMTSAIEHREDQALAYRVYQIHKSVGFLILALTALRLGWRLTRSPPPLPTSMKAWEVLAAHATHVAFYALMISLPLTGWLYVSAGWATSQDQALEVTTSWFGLFPVTHIPGVSFLSQEVRRAIAFQAMGAHAFLAWGAVVLIILHAGAALKHHFLDGDAVLAHMIPGLKNFGARSAEGGNLVEPNTPAHSVEPVKSSAQSVWLAWAETVLGLGMILTVAVAGAIAARPYPLETTPSLKPAAKAPAAIEDTPLSPGTATEWSVDTSTSSIRFSGGHAGATFNGRFEQWGAQIWFDPEDLAGSKASVTIQTSSARTGDATQEGSLEGAEWFDPASFPTARFVGETFRSMGGGRFEVAGTLRIKSITMPVTLPFAFSEKAGVATVDGALELDRTAFDLGMASDSEAEWVSKMIRVRVVVSARRK